MFKGLGNIAQLMKQMGEMQSRMAEMKQKLATLRVSGASADGLVTVEMTGDHQLVGCRVAPAALANGSDRMEAAISEAVNDAVAKAKVAATREMSGVMGGDNAALQQAMAQLGFSP